MRLVCRGTNIDESYNRWRKRFIYASSLSVFYNVVRRSYLDEQPPDGWSPYSLSKRLAEQMFLAGAAHYPKATILALRLMRPRNETDYQDLHHQPEIRSLCPLGPGDVRRLFLAALRCSGLPRRPGQRRRRKPAVSQHPRHRTARVAPAWRLVEAAMPPPDTRAAACCCEVIMMAGRNILVGDVGRLVGSARNGIP